ncbi:thioesterase family protein [Spiractinospora alimapuensis]|uniref:thioesterase family protein n=1 Tax=Spiractinospora alimapuensis TaxID=2820884 RepID=UPI001F356A62|nr:thioesterase family protein [Spiractinospora alimapuensis]QVQ50339.1 thioesterase family protein [Spiractinospora alimapuensis]
MTAQFQQVVQPEWIDYNGHLSEGYYVLIFGFATDAMMERIGLGPEYRERTRCSLYTVEAHVRYLRDIGVGDTAEVTTRVLGHAAKKLWFSHEMSVDGTVVATEELLALHVDQSASRACPFPDGVATTLAGLRESAPDYAGRKITLG